MKKFKKPSAGSPRGNQSGGGRGDARRSDGRRPEGRGDGRRPGVRAGQGVSRPHPSTRPESKTPEGRCIVGIHAVEELLNVRANTVTKFMMREKFEDHPALVALHERAKSRGVRVDLVAPGTLDKIVGSHQGVIAFSSAEPEIDWNEIEKAERCTLIALDEVEDPHNLGAVMRTAWLLGAKAVLTTERRSAQLSPAVSKVAQGAVEHVPVVADMSLPQQLEALKQHGFWILGLSHKAKQSIFELEVPDKVVWVLGSESSGIRKSVEGMCDDLISIPQLAPNASYNVSVAAAMALSETFRQRRNLAPE